MDKLLRIRLTTVVVLAAVFAAGLLLGLAVDRSLVATPADEVARTGGEEQPTERRHAGCSRRAERRIQAMASTLRSCPLGEPLLATL